MRLNTIPFELIKNGSKTVEIRLNDGKRQAIKIGDQIEFSLRPESIEKFRAEVSGLETFKTFKEAYSSYPPQEYGGKTQDEWEGMYKYYSPEDEHKFNVLGIRLRLLPEGGPQ